MQTRASGLGVVWAAGVVLVLTELAGAVLFWLGMAPESATSHLVRLVLGLVLVAAALRERRAARWLVAFFLLVPAVSAMIVLWRIWPTASGPRLWYRTWVAVAYAIVGLAVLVSSWRRRRVAVDAKEIS